jgi:hypothetical protein
VSLIKGLGGFALLFGVMDGMGMGMGMGYCCLAMAFGAC